MPSFLFSNPPSYPSPRRFSKEQASAWWNNLPPDYERLIELRRELLPLLKRIEEWDDACMAIDCLPGLPLRTKAHDLGYPMSWYDITPELELLRKSVPIDIQWTRRNRKLLRLALSQNTSEVTAYDLLRDR